MIDKLELKLILPVPVSINKLYINQYGYNPKTRQRAPTGARILSKEGEKSKKDIQDKVVEQMSGQDWDYSWTECKDNFLYMDVLIYFSRRGRDSDNIFKLLSDSLEKIVYDNDSRILPRVQKVLYDTKNPHIEVEFSPVEYVGVFKDKEEAAQFEDECQTCTRYLNRRCSILLDSLSGQVREELEMVDHSISCSKKKIKKV